MITLTIQTMISAFILIALIFLAVGYAIGYKNGRQQGEAEGWEDGFFNRRLAEKKRRNAKGQITGELRP